MADTKENTSGQVTLGAGKVKSGDAQIKGGPTNEPFDTFKFSPGNFSGNTKK